MFKIKAKLKESAVVREGMYFTYGLTIFKTSNIVDDKMRLCFYDETNGNILTIDTQYPVAFLQEAIISNKYKIVEPGVDFLIPDKLKDYDIQFENKT